MFCSNRGKPLESGRPGRIARRNPAQSDPFLEAKDALVPSSRAKRRPPTLRERALEAARRPVDDRHFPDMEIGDG